MKTKLRGRRPSPALIVSIVALVMSTAGTATAAKLLITSSSQIKNGAVTAADVKDGTLSAKDIKNGAITGTQVKGSSIGLDKLESSARQAINDSGTSASEAFRLDGPSGQEAAKLSRVATLNNLQPGVYAIFAKTIITSEPPNSGLLGQGETVSAHCILNAGGDTDEARALLGTPGALSPGVLNMQITRSFGGTGSAHLECQAAPAKWKASNTSIIAVRVGRAPRNPVEG
jgi:hypothetical protein